MGDLFLQSGSTNNGVRDILISYHNVTELNMSFYNINTRFVCVGV